MKGRSFLAQRPLAGWSLAYAAGLFAALNGGGFSMWLALAGLLAGTLAGALLKQGLLTRCLAVCLAFFFLGTLRMGLLVRPLLPAEGSYRVTGQVAGESQVSPDGLRVKSTLRQVVLRDEAGQETWVNRVYWSYYPGKDAPLPVDGQQVAFTGQVLHPQGQVNLHGFDFRRYLLSQGISLQISGARDMVFQEPVLEEAASLRLRVRKALGGRLDALFGETGGPLARALLLGHREGLEEDTQEDFRRAGIAHLLAVSGLHVGLLALFLTGLIKPLRLPPLIRLLLLGSLLFIYCALLDFRPSVLRASILSVLLLSGRLFRRRVDPLTSLAAAFLLNLLLRPLDLMNLGFQLSFLAVLGIILLGDRLASFLGARAWYVRMHPLGQKLLTAYGVTLAASLMTLVPLVNSFHRFSLLGILISPLAIGLTGLFMLGALILLLLSFPLMGWAAFLGQGLNLAAQVFLRDLARLADLPFAAFTLPRFSPLFAAAWYALLLLGTRYVVLRRGVRTAAAAALALALILLPLLPGDPSLRYVLLSSGFADSALILDGPHTTVIDTGEHPGDLMNLLYAEGRRIDRLIITHLHQDHAGGLQQVLDSGIMVEELLLPHGALDAQGAAAWAPLLHQAEAAGARLRYLGKGDVLTSPRVQGEVRWPVHGAMYPGRPANQGSLVIYWDLDGVGLLSPGDISANYAPYALRPAQVLKTAHHGGRADNPPGLLAQVQPQLALITASTRQADRYQASREHLDSLGALTLVTGETGAITLRIEGGQVHLSQHLQQQEE